MDVERQGDLDLPLVASTLNPTKERQTGSFSLFLATSLLCSVLMFPGLYITLKPESSVCDFPLFLWFQGATGLNLVSFCILLCQFLFSKDTTDHFWLLSMLPAPLFLLEVVLDLAGAFLITEAGWNASCRLVCGAMVGISLGKQYIHCFYSSSVLYQGCEEHGLRLLSHYFHGNVYQKCPVCLEIITPGQELAPQIGSEGSFLHLTCRETPENDYIEV